MIGRLFNQVDRIGRGLDAAWLRQEVIAQNIANVNTPNYNSKRVDFEDAYARALANQTGFLARRTRQRHIDFGEASDPMYVYPVVAENSHYTMRMDGNNVDIEQEETALAENTIRYDLLTAKLNAEFTRLRMAIREGK